MDQDNEAQRRAAFLELVASLRRAVAGCVSVGAPLEELRALADRASALAAAIASHAGEAPFPRYQSSRGRIDVFDVPYNPVSGPCNPLAPEVAIEEEEVGENGERVVAKVTFSKGYEGAPGWVHGGYVAAMYDQLLAFSNRRRGVFGVTRTLGVNYRRPTPIETELRFVTHCQQITDRDLHSRGECYLGDTLISDCEGVFARLNADNARRLFKMGEGAK